MRLTQVASGTSGTLGRTLVQVVPPSGVSCTLPSSVPVQITPGASGDSATVMRVPCVSALVTSRVSPPLSGSVFTGSLVDRSGLMIVHVSPRSVLLNRWLPPT